MMSCSNKPEGGNIQEQHDQEVEEEEAVTQCGTKETAQEHNQAQPM